MKIVKASKAHKLGVTRIVAADEDEQFDDFTLDDADDPDAGLSDQLDAMQDQIEDVKDAVDEIDEDDVNIDVDNNISGHYIAECDKCKGIFISAVIESDQVVTSVSGVCPLCQEETTQYLKWKIVPATESSNEDVSI